ncbi:MAG: TetR family transcriptional regulator [Candidatus Nanopelagicales bacterium]
MTATEASGARRRGPRSGGADTRAAILAAAREEFIEKGFAAATVRGIAARAGVDAAMINHYFGSKAGLFGEVTHIPVDPTAGLTTALAGPREQLGHRLALFVLTTWEDPAFRDPVLAMIRSADTEGNGVALMRGYFSSQLIPLVAEQARGPDPMRATVLAIAQVIGVVTGRHLIGLPQLSEPGVAELAAGIAPVVQRYLDGEHVG